MFQKPEAAGSDGPKRYLQCPAVVTMKLLKKFLRLKYSLTQTCTVSNLYGPFYDSNIVEV